MKRRSQDHSQRRLGRMTRYPQVLRPKKNIMAMMRIQGQRRQPARRQGRNMRRETHQMQSSWQNPSRRGRTRSQIKRIHLRLRNRNLLRRRTKSKPKMVHLRLRNPELPGRRRTTTKTKRMRNPRPS